MAQTGFYVVGLSGPLDSQRPATYATLEAERSENSTSYVVVLRESAGRLDPVQRLQLPEKSWGSTTIAAGPNGLLVAVAGLNNIY